ncbi:MAG: hypothetical protein AAF500_15045 [Myxococcota bacterium]
MAQTRSFLWGPSLLPILLLAGCPVYGNGPVEREIPVSCVSDYDCPLDAVCDAWTNQCVAIDYGICLTDGDCPVGSYCEVDEGACLIPNLAECREDFECSFGFECDFRDSCRPEQPGACLVDSDCLIGELCIENACLPIEQTCQFDFQCASGFTCANNRCRLLCGSSTRCPSGTACQESLCLPAVGQCIDSSDCPDLDTNCVEGVCLRRCEIGCDAATELCDPAGFCRPRTTPDPNAPNPFCRSDADCNGTLCVEGICRTECDALAPDPDAICESYDGQVPLCGPDNLCYAPSEMLSDCRVETDCADGQDCIDGQCR